MPPPYYPLYRDWDVYLTRVRFSSLATRSSFVSRVELLQHAPGITSRMFPACDVSQNALTLTDPSSALNSFKGPALEVTPALPSSVPPQHQSTLQNEQIQFFYHVLRYQRAMHRPAILEASGISFHYLVSGPLPPAYCGSPLASALSPHYSRVRLLDSRVTVAKARRLTVAAPRSLCALPLLTGKPAAGRA